MIGGINTWAVGVVRYSAEVVDWTMEERTSMDRRTGKILAMNSCLHTRSNVARLHLLRKEGERGLVGIEESVRKENIPVWLFKGEHRVDASSGTEGEGGC